MMNISELLTSIKMDLGIHGISLPFDDPDKTLIDVIKLKSIKTFSIFHPYILKVDLNLNELKALQSNYQESIYEIPDIFGEKRILYIRNVTPKNKYYGAAQYMTPVFDGSIEDYYNLMMGQAQANLTSTIAPPITFKFTHPNKMHLFNMSTMWGEISVEFALEHASNLSTIRPTAYQSFYELALLDVQIFLYNILKHYNEIQTAYGTINLRIDEWSGAKSERDSLIERWRNNFHIDIDPIYIV